MISTLNFLKLFQSGDCRRILTALLPTLLVLVVIFGLGGALYTDLSAPVQVVSLFMWALCLRALLDVRFTGFVGNVGMSLVMAACALVALTGSAYTITWILMMVGLAGLLIQLVKTALWALRVIDSQ